MEQFVIENFFETIYHSVSDKSVSFPHIERLWYAHFCWRLSLDPFCKCEKKEKNVSQLIYTNGHVISAWTWTYCRGFTEIQPGRKLWEHYSVKIINRFAQHSEYKISRSSFAHFIHFSCWTKSIWYFWFAYYYFLGIL